MKISKYKQIVKKVKMNKKDKRYKNGKIICNRWNRWKWKTNTI